MIKIINAKFDNFSQKELEDLGASSMKTNKLIKSMKSNTNFKFRNSTLIDLDIQK